MDSEQDVLFQQQGSTAVLTINREKARNSISAGVVAGFQAHLERIESDASVRAVVITGAGTRAFCAGGDLAGGAMADGMLAAHEGRRAYGGLLRRISAFPKPTIARVNGHALAGGLGLMLACDLAVAVDEAQFGTPEIDVGLFPMMVMALLQRHVGRKRALELVMTGDRLAAKDAASWGMINRVVPAAELDATVQALADKLAGKSRAVLGLGKRAFLGAEDLPFEPAVELLASQLSLNVLLEDAAEGVGAFLEKRKPNWNDR